MERAIILDKSMVSLLNKFTFGQPLCFKPLLFWRNCYIGAMDGIVESEAFTERVGTDGSSGIWTHYQREMALSNGAGITGA